MRPTLRILLGLALALALCGPSLVFAQSTAVQCFGPVTNSVICSYTSSTASTDGSPGSGAAQTIVNATLSTSFMVGQPVTMRVEGKINTAAASGTKTWTLSTSWGGNSLTIFSALTLTAGQADVPFFIYCKLDQNSSTAGSLAKALVCDAGYVSSGSSSAGTTTTLSRQRTTFTLTNTPTQAVTVSSTLSATTGLGLVVDRVTWNQGN